MHSAFAFELSHRSVDDRVACASVFSCVKKVRIIVSYDMLACGLKGVLATIGKMYRDMIPKIPPCELRDVGRGEVYGMSVKLSDGNQSKPQKYRHPG